jgi:hypothetical protein
MEILHMSTTQKLVKNENGITQPSDLSKIQVEVYLSSPHIAAGSKDPYSLL